MGILVTEPDLFWMYYVALCPDYVWEPTTMEPWHFTRRWQKIFSDNEDFFELAFLVLKCLVTVEATPAQQLELQRRILELGSARQVDMILPFFRKEPSNFITWERLRLLTPKKA